MKQVGKVKTIVKAFTSKPDVDEETLKYRREICKGCIFNSDNRPESELGLIDKARKKLLKGEPFCTACGCQINEKTGQATEECGLAEKGETPKWNRVKVETTNRFDLNIINESQDVINARLTEDGTQFELDFGSIKRSGTRDVSFLVESKLGVPLIFDYVKPSCNVCTSSSFEKVNKHQVRIKLKLDVEKISLGDFRKSLHIGYYLKSKYDKQTLKLVGTLNE